MGKVVSTTFISVDGVMESHDQWGDFWSDETRAYKNQEVMASDYQLLGRVTYELFAAAWPTITDEGELGDRMNAMPKLVASNTLPEGDATWNATVVRQDNLADAVNRLKQDVQGDILIHGSADLIGSLTEQGLIDEYRLMVYPVVVGSGKKLFNGGFSKRTLKLVDTLHLPNGVVNLSYHPA